MSTDYGFDWGGSFSILPAIWAALQASTLFHVIKWFLILYSLVLVADVVMLLFMRGIGENLKVQLYGATRPLIKKNEAASKWRGIERHLESDNPSHYKVAVLEADQFADSLLRESGFDGENMGERLANMHPGQLQSYEGLKDAHLIRNRIVNEPAFTLDREQAREQLEKYRALLLELELFS